MKDYSKVDLERTRPSVPLQQAIRFCLHRLYADKTKRVTDEVAGGLTYEELIGALLLAQDEINLSY